jgi:hypothetical protein
LNWAEEAQNTTLTLTLTLSHEIKCMNNTAS